MTEEEFRDTAKPLFYTRMRLGLFDPPEMVPYNQINMSVVQSSKHQKLAVKAGMMSFVLMKNVDNLLPLTKHYQTIAVCQIYLKSSVN